jgi:predicted metal-dependent RNase
MAADATEVCLRHLSDLRLTVAHADRKGLLEWIGALPSAPRRVFVTHGEAVAADSLRHAIEERHHWP